LDACLSASSIDIETRETSPPIAGDAIGWLIVSILVFTFKPSFCTRLAPATISCPTANDIELLPAGSALRVVWQIIVSKLVVMMHDERLAPPETGVKTPVGCDCPLKKNGGSEIEISPPIGNSETVSK
jgi:hypothetical protein